MSNSRSSETGVTPFNTENSRDWSPKQYLWLHLYYDLLFAAGTRTPVPLIGFYDAYVYKQFLTFSAMSRDKDADAVSITHTVGEYKDFIHERDAILPVKLSKLLSLQDKALLSAYTTRVYRFEITSGMVTEYEQLRGNVSAEAELPSPEKILGLWEFLNAAIDNQYPQLKYTPAAQLLARGTPDDQPEEHIVAAHNTDMVSSTSAQSAHREAEANQVQHAKRKIQGIHAQDSPHEGRTQKRIKVTEPVSSYIGQTNDFPLTKREVGHTPRAANETIEPHGSNANKCIFRYKAKLLGFDEEFEQVDVVDEFDSTASLDYDDKGKVCIYTIPRHGIPHHKAGQVWKWNKENQDFAKGPVTWKPVAIVRTFEKNTNKYIGYTLGSRYLEEMDLNVKNEARNRYGRWLSNYYKSNNTTPVNYSKLQWHPSERNAFYEYINDVIQKSQNGIMDLEKNLKYREAAKRINAVRAKEDLKGKDRTHNAVQSQWGKASKVRDRKIFDLKQRIEQLKTWEGNKGRDKEHPTIDLKIGIRIDNSAQDEVNEEAEYEDEDN